MKKLMCILAATLVVGCGSSQPSAPTFPGATQTRAITKLDAEAIHVLGIEVRHMLGRPTGAVLTNADRFTDIVGPLLTLVNSGPGPGGGTVEVQQTERRTIVFDHYKTSAGAVITGTVEVLGNTLTF